MLELFAAIGLCWTKPNQGPHCLIVMTEREHTVAVLVLIHELSELVFITIKCQATKTGWATRMTCFLNANRKHYNDRFKLLVINYIEKMKNYTVARKLSVVETNKQSYEGGGNKSRSCIQFCSIKKYTDTYHMD